MTKCAECGSILLTVVGDDHNKDKKLIAKTLSCDACGWSKPLPSIDLKETLLKLGGFSLWV